MNIGSLWANEAIGATPSSAYSLAKGGLHALTRNLALELAPHQIRVNTVAPAVVGDSVQVRQRLRYTLSVDHRVIDGALAAKFLQTLTSLIEHPWMIIA